MKRMKIILLLSSLISLSLLSCSNDGNIVKVPAGNFSYIPLKHWQFAFDVHEHEEEYRIYTALYEIKAEKTDTTVALVYIHAQHLEDKNNFECESFERYEHSSLQKAFQKKYGLKEPNLCTLIDAKKRLYCDSEVRIDFQFQNEDVFIQCYMAIVIFDQPELYDESQLIDDFDTFVRSFAKL